MSTLSDDYIVREALSALRSVSEGQASLAAAGERFMRRMIGLEHEMPAAYGAHPGSNPPSTEDGS